MKILQALAAIATVIAVLIGLPTFVREARELFRSSEATPTVATAPTVNPSPSSTSLPTLAPALALSATALPPTPVVIVVTATPAPVVAVQPPTLTPPTRTLPPPTATAPPPPPTPVPRTPTPEPKLRVGERITIDQTIPSPLTQYWVITLEWVEINAEGVVKANFRFDCHVNVGTCQRERAQDRTTAWLEDAAGKRYPMIEGSGSPLEAPGQQGQTNASYDGFLLFLAPDPQKMPVTIIYGSGNAFRGIQLTR